LISKSISLKAHRDTTQVHKKYIKGTPNLGEKEHKSRNSVKLEKRGLLYTAI